MRTALIVGAGIGGLSAGLALERAGWHVRIFERAANPRDLGFALMLAPNAMAALRELGLADTLIDEGFVPTVFEVRQPQGRVLRRFDASAGRRPDERSVVAMRSVLHGALLNAVGDDALSLDSEAVDLAWNEIGVEVTLANGQRITGDVLIGADGLGSIVRKRLHPRERPMRRSGFFALRGLAQGAAEYLGDASAVGYLGNGVEVGSARASETAVYWYVSLLARDIPAGARDPRQLLSRFTAGFEERFRAMARATAPDDLRLDELFDRDPMTSWGAGFVTLAGDAAHPMLPHTGQGAAQALEDAVALGLVLKPAGDPAQALRRYERVRGARTRRIVRLGRRIARTTTTRNAVIRWLRDAAVRIVPASMLVSAIQLGGVDPHRELRGG